MSFSTSLLHIALLFPPSTAVENSGERIVGEKTVGKGQERWKVEGRKVEGGKELGIVGLTSTLKMSFPFMIYDLRLMAYRSGLRHPASGKENICHQTTCRSSVVG
jgi:hypothetical protein